MPDFGLVLGVAFALLLIVEGIGPFAFPNRWRLTLQQLSQLPERSLRILGLVMMIAGLLLLTFLGSN